MMLFILRRLQAIIKVQTGVLDELLYADDMEIANIKTNMQKAMDQVSQSCENYELTISTKKTEVVHQAVQIEPTNTMNGHN